MVALCPLFVIDGRDGIQGRCTTRADDRITSTPKTILAIVELGSVPGAA